MAKKDRKRKVRFEEFGRKIKIANLLLISLLADSQSTLWKSCDPLVNQKWFANNENITIPINVLCFAGHLNLDLQCERALEKFEILTNGE